MINKNKYLYAVFARLETINKNIDCKVTIKKLTILQESETKFIVAIMPRVNIVIHKKKINKILDDVINGLGSVVYTYDLSNKDHLLEQLKNSIKDKVREVVNLNIEKNNMYTEFLTS